MANCPNCKREWRWDWDSDVLRKPNGQVVSLVSRNTPKLTDQDCQTAIMVCDCGCVLTVLVSDELGLTAYNHPKMTIVYS